MLMLVIRVVFMLALAGVGMVFLSGDTSGAAGDDFFSLINTNKDLALLCCVGLALVIIAFDIFIPRKSLGAISGLFFGLLVGMVVAFALSLILDLMVESFLPRLRTPIVANVPKEETRWVQDPTNPGQLISRTETKLVSETVGKQDHPVLSAVKVMIGVVCCYLAASFILQTKDDVRFIIPYVEFAKQTKGGRPFILDTSVIIDGRIGDIVDTHIIESELVVPRFVLQELQAIADSSDRLKRSRGRRGLDVLNKLQIHQQVDVNLLDVSADGAGGARSVDERLVEVAKGLNGRVVTNDYNLGKIAQLRGVAAININDLANALKPVFLPGETLSIRVLKSGEEAGQGVGYLEDGTMVVVEGGRDKIGQTVNICVTSALQTSAGRMIFGRTEGAPVNDRRRQRPNRPAAPGDSPGHGHA